MKLYVSPDGLNWKVQWQGGNVASRHGTQTDAIKSARKLVGSLSEGTCSQILVQRPDGTFRTEWTYGEDPFPPPG